MVTKECNKCFLEIPLDGFYKNNKGKLGRHSMCKKCFKQYELENKERIKAYQKEWNRKNKEYNINYNKEYQKNNKDKLNRVSREYYANNREERKNKMRKYYQENKDKYYDYHRKRYEEHRDLIIKRSAIHGKVWRKENKELVNHYTAKYRNAKNKLPSNFTLEDWDIIRKHFDNSCAYCGEVSNLEREHVIPVSKGGGYVKGNIIPACRSCNASKNNKSLDEWYPLHDSYSIDREKKIIGISEIYI